MIPALSDSPDVVARAQLPAVIVDVDGTLVDVSGVRHYVLDDPRRKDFHHFHLGAIFCPPIESTVALVRTLHDAGIAVFVVTARKEQWRRNTSDWLAKHGIEYRALLMRADDDDRRDVLVKTDILTEIQRTHRVVLAVDDNPSVIELWSSMAIPTVIVPGWQTTSHPTTPAQGGAQ